MANKRKARPRTAVHVASSASTPSRRRFPIREKSRTTLKPARPSARLKSARPTISPRRRSSAPTPSKRRLASRKAETAATARPAPLPRSSTLWARRDPKHVLYRHASLIRRAETLANFGTWEYDVASDTVVGSQSTFAILGAPYQDGPIPLNEIGEAMGPGHSSVVRAKFESIIAGRRPVEFVAQLTGSNGQTRTRRSIVTPVFDRSGNVARLAGITLDETARRLAEEQLRGLSHRLLNLRNDEQRRMSRNLHETVAQTVTALKMALGKLAHAVPSPEPDFLEQIAAARLLADDALREVRAVSALLYPPLLEEIGLIPAIRGYTHTLSERIGTTIRVDVPSDLPRMPREIEVTLFRALQESLTNIHRHSKASACTIRLRRTAESVEMEVRDNGVGISPESQIQSVNTLDAHVGIGIAGMRDRVRQLDGVFRVNGTPGRGTAVYVELPLTVKPSEDRATIQEVSS